MENIFSREVFHYPSFDVESLGILKDSSKMKQKLVQMVMPLHVDGDHLKGN